MPRLRATSLPLLSAQVLLCVFLWGLVATHLMEAVAGSGGVGVSMGTTVVALRTKSGLVVGADTRTSMGSMVSNRLANKLSFLYQSDRGDNGVTCVLCRSGSAADTQYLADQAQSEFRSRALWYGMTQPSIAQIARWLRYELVRERYSASLLCAGYDPREGRGRIYSIAQTGSMIEEDVYAIAGSGSTYILGLIDHALRGRTNGELMDETDAIEFVATLVHTAMARDGSSGGFARIVVMNDSGCREFSIVPTSTTQTSSSSSDNANRGNRELPGFKSTTRPSSTGGQGKGSKPLR